MPRVARNIYEEGYRHVIVRGIGKQILFEDENDYGLFLRLLERYSRETSVDVCAYCLMENHVHLLLHDRSTDTALFMKKVGVSYSAYYNRKYERTGHLFQDRYKCENITDDRGYLTVLRYILRNPEKAGFCKTEKYQWSSFGSYGDKKSFLDQSLTWSLFENMSSFRDYMVRDNADSCMESDGRMDDGRARNVIKDKLGISSGTVLQGYDKAKRNKALKELKEIGLSIRQIERLTGINRGVIQRA